MSNAINFITLCTKDANNEQTKTKLLNYIERDKEQANQIHKSLLIYGLMVMLVLFIIFRFILQEKNIVNIYPFLLLPIIWVSIISIGVKIHTIIYYPKMKKKIINAKSIKVSDKSYTFLYEKNSDKIKVVCFKESDYLNPKNKKYKVGKQHPKVNYDKLIKEHNYYFYSLEDKILFIIDEYN